MKTNEKVRQADESGVSDALTRSEKTCLSLVAEGMKSSAMCDLLELSAKEIEVLLFCAQRKLGADNLLHAVSIAMSRGIISV